MKFFRIDSRRLQITFFLFSMSLFCFALSLVRYAFTGSPVYLFLNWNLFLAFIPWCVGTLLSGKLEKSSGFFTTSVLLSAWILFFPNSPYILTDLFHLKARNPVPLWYDLVVILSFAWTGLTFGFISLLEIETLLTRHLNKTLVGILSSLLLFLGSFGVYLGRYLRWNSWDLFSEPSPLLYDIGARIANPFSYPATWGMTLLLGILLNMIFWTFKIIRTGNEKENVLLKN
ncbi:MAG TPA: DUF1361 domain-containing protein [Bacteroidia bacterium]|nr:DUF1361 domain-containing protein [Bacteroidia bacterium]HNP99741.1 DUF1361 domain-containing protein [Bacteroidia bacterium]